MILVAHGHDNAFPARGVVQEAAHSGTVDKVFHDPFVVFVFPIPRALEIGQAVRPHQFAAVIELVDITVEEHVFLRMQAVKSHTLHGELLPDMLRAAQAVALGDGGAVAGLHHGACDDRRAALVAVEVSKGDGSVLQNDRVIALGYIQETCRNDLIEPIPVHITDGNAGSCHGFVAIVAI